MPAKKKTGKQGGQVGPAGGDKKKDTKERNALGALAALMDKQQQEAKAQEGKEQVNNKCCYHQQVLTFDVYCSLACDYMCGFFSLLTTSSKMWAPWGNQSKSWRVSSRHRSKSWKYKRKKRNLSSSASGEQTRDIWRRARRELSITTQITLIY